VAELAIGDAGNDLLVFEIAQKVDLVFGDPASEFFSLGGAGIEDLVFDFGQHRRKDLKPVVVDEIVEIVGAGPKGFGDDAYAILIDVLTEEPVTPSVERFHPRFRAGYALELAAKRGGGVAIKGKHEDAIRRDAIADPLLGATGEG